MLGALVAASAEPGGEGGRVELLAAGVKEDGIGGQTAALAAEKVEKGGFVAEGLGFNGVVGLDAFEVEVGEGVEGSLCA